MPRADRILLVRTCSGLFEQASYIIHALSDEWRRHGIAIDWTDRLVEPTGPDVLVFPHFDVTVTPPEQAEVFNRCARVINRSVTNISKRRVSRQRVRSPDACDGPVIVKTNRNFGGTPEALAARKAGGMKRYAMALRRRLPWTISGLPGSGGYRIYDHPRLVPCPVWFNPQLIVERFRPEREGELYAIRQYVFLGSREVCTRSLSPKPIVKSADVVKREILAEIPAAVREFRRELGFDYGKFDYVVNEGEEIIFDVNRTPGFNPNSKAGSANALIPQLAPGIFPFMGQS